MKDIRAEKLAHWARSVDLPTTIPSTSRLVAVSDDASFRRYFRFAGLEPSLIFVDAPPEHEDSASFIKVSAALRHAGIACPEVLAADLDQGFMVVSDLGDQVYLAAMNSDPSRVAGLYDDALACNVRMLDVACDLPDYDRTRLLSEMSLFEQWFLTQQLQISVPDSVNDMLQTLYELLVQSARSQPQVFVHRDFHCRNLMVIDDNSPGVIDFQDAVIGPITYDLVSLYKDCYYRFERTKVETAVARYHRALVARKIVDDRAPVLRWFDLMGVQRHLKCAGIFSRLNLRDGKPGYLHDIPLVISYLVEAAERYSELAPLGGFLRAEVLPRLPDLADLARRTNGTNNRSKARV